MTPDEPTLYPKSDLYRLNLPLEIARQLYDASSQDHTFRLPLYHTVCVGEHEGKIYLVATDTHRMYAVDAAEHPGARLPLGTYRWLRRPVKGEQLVEAVDDNFPNWQKIVSGYSTQHEKAAVWCPKDGWLSMDSRFAVNIRYLPTPRTTWTLWKTGDAQPKSDPPTMAGQYMKPLLCLPEDKTLGIYILMPMQIV